MSSGEDDGYDQEMQTLIDQVTQSCMTRLKDDRAKSDQQQLQELGSMLQDWSDRVVKKTSDSVSTRISKELEEKGLAGSGGRDTAASAIDSIQKDLQDRQGGLVATIQEAHARQLEVLRAAIGEERRQFAQSQLIFEQTLKTRYECMVDALNEKVKAEQEARMQRALESLERAARLESERAKQSFEIQQEAELTLSKKFKSIVSDLRRSWEEEETGRAMQLEERLRSHYSVVLEHMEAQLKMALRLQDDADKQWLEDVEARNRQQIETLRAFEDKCRRLYDVRLTEYAEKTSQQIAQYEDQLLEAGSVLASEKAQFESRLRRLKLACSRWKVAYQRDVHGRYQQMAGALEERYMGEVAERLQELQDLRAQLGEAQAALQSKEQEIIRVHKMYAPGVGSGDGAAGAGGGVPSTSSMRTELAARWNELKTPPAERVESLAALLDEAQVTPQLVTRYEALMARLAARQPIAQLVGRKQFIEYKLKLASRMSGGGGAGGDGMSGGAGAMSAAERAALITELTEVQNSAEAMMRQYEKQFGETYHKAGGAGNLIASAASYQAQPQPQHQPQHQAQVQVQAPSVSIPHTPTASMPTSSSSIPQAQIMNPGGAGAGAGAGIADSSSDHAAAGSSSSSSSSKRPSSSSGAAATSSSPERPRMERRVSSRWEQMVNSKAAGMNGEAGASVGEHHGISEEDKEQQRETGAGRGKDREGGGKGREGRDPEREGLTRRPSVAAMLAKFSH